jgi:hypothetical protein
MTPDNRIFDWRTCLSGLIFFSVIPLSAWLEWQAIRFCVECFSN